MVTVTSKWISFDILMYTLKLQYWVIDPNNVRQIVCAHHEIAYIKLI